MRRTYFISSIRFLVLIGILACIFTGSLGKAEATVYIHGSPITFSWEAAPGPVDHYNVYISIDNQPFALYQEMASPSCQFYPEDGRVYVVQVDAEDELGNRGPMSEPSDEIVVYLNGSEEDTDGDGMKDDWEAVYGFNPYDPADGVEDLDGDMLSNRDEYLQGTDPTDLDSDDDGVSDGAEVVAGENPLDPSDHVPVADAGDDRELDPTLVTLDGSGSFDPNGDPLTYLWTQEGGRSVALSDADTAHPSFLGKKRGNYRFRLTVNDGIMSSSPDNVTIAIRNVAPTANAGVDQVVDAGTQVFLDGSGSQDPNEDTLRFAWSQTGGAVVSLEGAATQTSSFVPQSSGVYTFSLVVSDDQLNSTPDEVQVVVNALNQVPTADAGENQTVYVNDTVTLDGSGSTDPDGDSLAYTWSQEEGPETVTLEGASSAQPQFVATQTGVFQFRLVVDDGNDVSAPDTVTVTVESENHVPVAVVMDVPPVRVGDWISLNGEGSFDPDDDDLIYTWSQTQGPLVSLEGADTATAGFFAVTESVLKFQLVVADGELTSAPAGVEVTVNGANQVPVADAGEDFQAELNSQTCLDGSGSYDPDPEDVITFSWSQVEGPLVTLYGADTETPCFSPSNSGDYLFELIVSDGEVQSTADQVTVHVETLENHAPVAEAGEYQAALPGETFVLDGSLSYDEDGDSLEYLWKQTAGPKMLFDSKSTLRIEASADEEGYYVFSLKVYDGKDWSLEDYTVVWVTLDPPPGCSSLHGTNPGRKTSKSDVAYLVMLFLPALGMLSYRKWTLRR